MFFGARKVTKRRGCINLDAAGAAGRCAAGADLSGLDGFQTPAKRFVIGSQLVMATLSLLSLYFSLVVCFYRSLDRRRVTASALRLYSLPFVDCRRPIQFGYNIRW